MHELKTARRKIGWEDLMWGFVLIGIGATFWLHELGWLDAWETLRPWDFWPVALILIGLSKLLPGEDKSGGAFFLVLGVLFLLNNLDYMSIRQTWPLLLVVFGAGLAWRSVHEGKSKEKHHA